MNPPASTEPQTSVAPLLRVEDLSISFVHDGGEMRVVDSMQFEVDSNEVIGLVGESGSGKSMSCKAVLSLLPKGAHVRRGAIHLEGRDVCKMSRSEQASTRGKIVGLIPQDPLSSLNPVLRIGTQITETIRFHRGLSKSEASDVAVELLRMVQIGQAERVMRQYPHQLSGGMRQRAASVIALSAQPKLLIADEPTTSLDVTIQHEFIKMLQELQRELGFGMIFVTHDLALISNIAERVYVMRKGLLVEKGLTSKVFSQPESDYTKTLLNSVPRIEGSPDAAATKEATL